MASNNGNWATGITTACGHTPSRSPGRAWRSLLGRGRGFWACGLVFLLASRGISAGESAPSLPAAPVPPADTNSLQLLDAIHQLESQLRSNQLAIEQNALEARVVAARNAEALSNGLQTLEKAFAAQQEAASARSASELNALRSSNRVMLAVAGSFAVITSLAMLMIAYFQWRTSRVWAEISTVLPVTRGLGYGPSPPELETGDPRQLGHRRVEETNARVLGAMQQLERRVRDMEHHPAAAPHTHNSSLLPDGNGSAAGSNGGRPGETPEQAADDQHARIPALLRQGQSRLKENDPEGALKCFDEVLSLDPNQGEALVKKGAAFERMHKLNEAFECYDRAIKTEGSPTVAYLYKGGLCSRLERFKEALECYEQALRAHDAGPG